MLSELKELYAFNRWANGRILGASSRLSRDEFTRDLGSSFPSVRDTLVHVLSAEWIWLARWKGVSPSAMLDPDAFPDLEAVRSRWEEVEKERGEYLSGLTSSELRRVVSYTNTAGERWAYPLWQMLRHVVNHSSYHRGQVVTMLRQLGHPGVGTDLLLFYDERAAGGADGGE